jgi:hypothetical protein
MIADTSFHSGRNSEGLMYSAEVVMNSIEGNRMTKVINPLAKAIRQPGSGSI